MLLVTKIRRNREFMIAVLPAETCLATWRVKVSTRRLLVSPGRGTPTKASMSPRKSRGDRVSLTSIVSNFSGITLPRSSWIDGMRIPSCYMSIATAS